MRGVLLSLCVIFPSAVLLPSVVAVSCFVETFAVALVVRIVVFYVVVLMAVVAVALVVVIVL